MQFQEAEIQVLIALTKLNEAAVKYFKGSLVEWDNAAPSLAKSGLISSGNPLKLTEAGAAAAKAVLRERPAMWYTYNEFWKAARSSMAFKTYSERLCGINLGHDGFSDLSQINLLIDSCGISGEYKILEAGCGSGLTAEYISDKTGASVLGVDYAAPAVDWAQERTASKRPRLSFQSLNMASLPYPSGSFDIVYSIDSMLGEQEECDETVMEFARALKNQGKLAIFWGGFLLWPGQPREELLAENTTVGKALLNCGLKYMTIDLSERHYRFMQRKRRVAQELKSAFESEKNDFLYDKFNCESADPGIPYDPATCFTSRFLYLADIVK